MKYLRRHLCPFSSLTNKYRKTDKMDATAIGIYIHVPFCLGKCPYCDFYSVYPDEIKIKEYLSAVKMRIKEYSLIYNRKVKIKTVYFGGGTPNLIGHGGISEIINEINEKFNTSALEEITVECNPNSVSEEFFLGISKAGVNRISMGLQSANESELKFLGRKHNSEDVKNAVSFAKKAGIDNISLDLMIGLENQSEKELENSIEFCSSLGVKHISSYILKVEENTPFAKKNMLLPDEDKSAALYLFVCEELEKRGYLQYEISNYSKENFESRHNLIYWQGKEYIGIGPGAHSFIEGKRFYYERDLKKFINGALPIPDGEGGDFEEFLMLNLRLKRGLFKKDCIEKYENGEKLFTDALKKASKIPSRYIEANENNISLTREGFLISNTLISMLL